MKRRYINLWLKLRFQLCLPVPHLYLYFSLPPSGYLRTPTRSLALDRFSHQSTQYRMTESLGGVPDNAILVQDYSLGGRALCLKSHAFRMLASRLPQAKALGASASTRWKWKDTKGGDLGSNRGSHHHCLDKTIPHEDDKLWTAAKGELDTLPTVTRGVLRVTGGRNLGPAITWKCLRPCSDRLAFHLLRMKRRGNMKDGEIGRIWRNWRWRYWENEEVKIGKLRTRSSYLWGNREIYDENVLN